MVYPVQRPTRYKRKKQKKRKKWPIVVLTLILIIAATAIFLYFSYNRLYGSKAMQDDVVDFLFYLEGRDEIFLIRTDKKEKINYLISVPSISYEPIMAISMDRDSPKDMYRSAEKLFGESDMSFFSTIDRESFQHISELSRSKENLPYDELTVDQFATYLKAIDLGFFEFLFFPEVSGFTKIQKQDNFTKNGGYRLLYNVDRYANKSIPLDYMTEKPVKITVTKQNGEEMEYQRLYIDYKSLETIKEFMHQ